MLMVPPPPLAGTVLPGPATVTAHLDKVEGAVTVFHDEPQAVSSSEQISIVAIAAKPRSQCVTRVLPIAGTAVVPPPKSHCFQDAYQDWQL